jgi:hypothetical protein
MTIERWSGYDLDFHILSIAAEMNRGRKRLLDSDRVGLGLCYERVLVLTDLTIQVHALPGVRRELLRWRDLVAALFVADLPRLADHDLALRALLDFTPSAHAQARYLVAAHDHADRS